VINVPFPCSYYEHRFYSDFGFGINSTVSKPIAVFCTSPDVGSVRYAEADFPHLLFTANPDTQLMGAYEAIVILRNL
jgi:hypothetical protein